MFVYDLSINIIAFYCSIFYRSKIIAKIHFINPFCISSKCAFTPFYYTLKSFLNNIKIRIFKIFFCWWFFSIIKFPLIWSCLVRYIRSSIFIWILLINRIIKMIGGQTLLIALYINLSHNCIYIIYHCDSIFILRTIRHLCNSFFLII